MLLSKLCTVEHKLFSLIIQAIVWIFHERLFASIGNVGECVNAIEELVSKKKRWRDKGRSYHPKEIHSR